jgi:hypothetical protein
MNAKTNEIISSGTKIGAVLGGMVFLFFGIVPGFYYGGYGTLMLMSKIVGGPVEATLMVRVVLVLGTVLGIACVGALSIVLGSVAGTLAGGVANALSGLRGAAKGEVVHHRH